MFYTQHPEQPGNRGLVPPEWTPVWEVNQLCRYLVTYSYKFIYITNKLIVADVFLVNL